MSSVPAPPPALLSSSRPPLTLAPQQIMLIGLLIFEIAIFSISGTNFLTLDNLLRVPTLNTDVALLALALTPVILTGGIDLSVGSLMGLSAVIFGKLVRDGLQMTGPGAVGYIEHAGFSIPTAAGCAIVLGALAGSLNAFFITVLRMPPLIVTLGSMRLFRGIANGITGGTDNFTGFSSGFILLGRGTLGQVFPWLVKIPVLSFLSTVPIPIPILLIAIAFFYVLVHRSTVGRGLSAIGYAPEGARYAGIPVHRRIALTYILSGLLAAIAAIIYVSRQGQAKADAGTQFELSAITAVVLGGTSIFGGRASVLGTVMGIAAIALLENGLVMSALPSELTGVLKGVLLLVAIAVDWKPGRIRPVAATVSGTQRNVAGDEEIDMKNSQVAVLSVVILLAAAMIAGGNYLLVSRLVTNGSPGGFGSPAAKKRTTVAMMPKSKGNAYFIACKGGAEAAQKELDIDLIWDGPTNPDPAEQGKIVDQWVTRGVDVIAVAVENRDGLANSLREAKAKGIKVVTYDADTQPDARDLFVNQATPAGIGNALMDSAAKSMNNEGEFAIITASLTASNMNEWRKVIEARLKEKYPKITLVDTRPCDDKKDKAFEEAKALLNKNPKLKLIMAICSPAVPGAAEAIKQTPDRKDVKVVGLGLPNDNKPYVHEGITDAVILWNTSDLGYLTVKVAVDLKNGKVKPGDTEMDGGRIGKVKIEGDNVILGTPTIFTKENIDQYDF